MNGKISKSGIKRRTDLFKKKVYEYQEFCGLLDWEIHVYPLNPDNDDRAQCSWNTSGKIASIFYSEGWLSEPGTIDAEIIRVAFHECCELKFNRIHDALEIAIPRDAQCEMIHEIIRFMENRMISAKPQEAIK